MDEQTIKVLARFVEIGQRWPRGAWCFVGHVIKYADNETGWFKSSGNIREHYEICELEANQMGYHRTSEKDRYAGHG
jgi:hypothetical protein